VTKGTETRQRIVDRALALASTEGIEGITLGVLADSLSLSKSGLFAHFKSREALQIAILDDAAARFIERVVSPGMKATRGEPRVRALFERWLDWGLSRSLPGGCIFVAAAVELDDRPGPVRDTLVRGQRAWISTIADAARGAIEEGHFSSKVDPEGFAFELYGLALATHHAARLLREPKTLEHARAGFERLIASARPAPASKSSRARHGVKR